jgi:hypothetical protein
MRISKMSSTCTYRYIMSKHVSYFSWTCKLLQLFMKFSKWLSAKLTVQYSSDWITVTWWIHVIKRVRINIGAEKGRTVEITHAVLFIHLGPVVQKPASLTLGNSTVCSWIWRDIFRNLVWINKSFLQKEFRSKQGCRNTQTKTLG